MDRCLKSRQQSCPVLCAIHATLYIDSISEANIDNHTIHTNEATIDICAIHIDEATIDIDAIYIYEATIGVDAIYVGAIRGPDLPERARDLGVVGLVDS